MPDVEKTEQEILEEVETKAGTDLEKVFGDSNPDELEDDSTSEQAEENQDEQTDETEDSDDSTSKKTDDSESEDDSTSDSESDSKGEQTDESDSKEDESKLTAAEIRAAIHCNWSEDEIKELEKVNPELAKKTCAKFLTTTNDLSKKFSELGKAQVKKDSTDAKQKQEPVQKVEKKSIDFAALEKEYENDPIVDVLKQVVERNDALATEVESLRSSGSLNEAKVTEAQAKEDQVIAQDIQEFFDNLDIKVYGDTYGKVEGDNWDNLTQAQVKKRWSVVETANTILLGAQQQGIEMSVKEAMSRANLLETHDISAQIERNKIKSKTVKRSKSISFEPSSSNKTESGNKKSVAKAIENAGPLLQKTFFG